MYTKKGANPIGFAPSIYLELFADLGDNAGTNGAAAFTDSEAQTFLARNGRDQGDLHVDVVARHDHLNALGQLDVAGNVGGTEVELRTIAVEERGMTPPSSFVRT